MTKRIDMPEAEAPNKHIIIFICPTEGCEDFYASPDFTPTRTDLFDVQQRRSQEGGKMVESHARVECPTCRTRLGLRVQRKAYVVTQVVDLDAVLRAHGHKPLPQIKTQPVKKDEKIAA